MRTFANRAKLFNYRLKLWKVADQLPTKTKFDGILVDAPCSGMGTWGRNPHARWTTKPSDITNLSAIQTSILSKVSDSLKPGGKLIYSVCTLAAAETSAVTDTFEKTHPTLERITLTIPGAASGLSSRLELRPEQFHSVGMFIAAWRRPS